MAGGENLENILQRAIPEKSEKYPRAAVFGGRKSVRVLPFGEYPPDLMDPLKDRIAEGWKLAEVELREGRFLRYDVSDQSREGAVAVYKVDHNSVRRSRDSVTYSGVDYYINEAGLVVPEEWIRAQTSHRDMLMDFTLPSTMYSARLNKIYARPDQRFDPANLIENFGQSPVVTLEDRDGDELPVMRFVEVQAPWGDFLSITRMPSLDSARKRYTPGWTQALEADTYTREDPLKGSKNPIEGLYFEEKNRIRPIRSTHPEEIFRFLPQVFDLEKYLAENPLIKKDLNTDQKADSDTSVTDKE